MAVTDRQRRIGKGRYQWVGRWVAAMWWSHLEHEWHAVPPWVVHVQDGGRECLRPRPLVPDFGIGAVAVVLAHHEIVQCHWAACVEHLELLLADVLGREVERLLHRHQRHHLRRGGVVRSGRVRGPAASRNILICGRMGRLAAAVGGRAATHTNARTCKRWFCITSRMIPSAEYTHPRDSTMQVGMGVGQ